jgi:toxin ParE1/3/4
LNGKPLIVRAKAVRDLEITSEFYREEAGLRVARSFLVAVRDTFKHLAERPSAGSPRYAHELKIRDLKSWRLKTFPFLVFYVEQDGGIEVLRVLHAQRDIAATMGEGD